MAKTSKAQLMSQAKFKADKRDTLTVDLPKGTKAGYKAKAANLGLSLTALIQRGVESYGVGNESVLPTTTTTQSEPQLTSEQRKILDAFDALPADTKKALIKVLFALSKQPQPDNA